MTQTKRRRRGKPPVITVAEVDALKAKGFNQSEIAEMYGVTRAYISWIKHTYGGKKTPREKILEEAWPWTVADRFTRSIPYRALRDHAEYVATKGKGMTDRQLDMLRTFYRQTENVVVMYDPDNPPTPGISAGGFMYVPREESDGNMMIRLADGEDMSAKTRAVYTRPTRLP